MLPDLKYLELSDNQLSGEIPAELGMLSTLGAAPWREPVGRLHTRLTKRPTEYATFGSRRPALLLIPRVSVAVVRAQMYAWLATRRIPGRMGVAIGAGDLNMNVAQV